MTESESVALPFGDGPLLVDEVLICFPHVLSTSVIIGQVTKDCKPFFEKTAFEFLTYFVQ